MSLRAVLALLKAEVEYSGSIRRTAVVLGVTPAYLGRVLQGKTRPGPTLLHQLGYTASREIVTRYTKTHLRERPPVVVPFEFDEAIRRALKVKLPSPGRKRSGRAKKARTGR